MISPLERKKFIFKDRKTQENKYNTLNKYQLAVM